MVSFSSIVKKMATYGLILSSLCLVISCASSKPPTEQVARTEAAINQANQVGAQDYAPLQLRNARKKLDQTKNLIQQKKYDKARRMAERAQVDAELAEETSLSKKARDAVKQLKESIKILKQEIQEKQKNQ